MSKPDGMTAITIEEFAEMYGNGRKPADIYQKIVLMGERPQRWNVLKRMHWAKWQVEVDRCKWLILAAIGIQPEPLAEAVTE